MLLAGETLSISPGKPLGPLILKKTSAAEVVRMLGRPDAEEPDEELVGYSVYYYAREKWAGEQLVVRFDAAGILDRVEFSSERYRTSTGIGVDNFEAHMDEFEVSSPKPEIIPGWGIDMNAGEPDAKGSPKNTPMRRSCSALELSGRFTGYRDPISEDCGSYSLFLFNNGILIVSKGGGCFGNHGQSDPAGFYLAQ